MLGSPSTLPLRWKTCWAPPASAAFGRCGCANSRCLVGALRLTADCGRVRAFGAALRRVARLGAFVAAWRVAEAASDGAASLRGSLSSLVISAWVTDCVLGAG